MFFPIISYTPPPSGKCDRLVAMCVGIVRCEVEGLIEGVCRLMVCSQSFLVARKTSKEIGA